MCGVAGIFRPDGRVVHEDELRPMQATLEHRGPDGNGRYTSPGIGLAHTRLAILDLSDRAAQPMVSSDQRYVMSYNGEIFNFRELRAELETIGANVESSGDTQVLLEHLARFGVEATLPKLEGQFAIALWDTTERTLVLARDRHGIKPLYYFLGRPDEVRFASEMKALVEGRGKPQAGSLDAMLLGMPCTWGQYTVFQDLLAVLPGEWLVFRDRGEPQRNRFFALADFADPRLYETLSRATPDEVMERVQAAFAESLDYRLISDAPVACLASGGVDSSLVSSVVHARQPGIELYHADVTRDSERPAAELLAQTLGKDLHTTRVTDEDFVANVPAVTYHNDLPIIYHMNSVPFYLVCKLARDDGIKVLLSGEGSDEYFLGYPRHLIEPLLKIIDTARGGLQSLLHGVSPKLGSALWPREELTYRKLFNQLVTRYQFAELGQDAEAAFDFIPAGRQRSTHLATLSLVRGHLSSLLHRNDRLGMAWSQESRFPFLGHSLARLAMNLPGKYKARFTTRFHDWRHPFIVDKWPVRQLCTGRVPDSLVHRGKRGFPLSFYHHFSLSPEFFRDGFVAEWYGLPGSAIEQALNCGRKIWAARLMCLEVWGKLFVRGQSIDEAREHLLRHVALPPNAA